MVSSGFDIEGIQIFGVEEILMAINAETLKVEFEFTMMIDSEVNHFDFVEMLKEFEINLEGKQTIGIVLGPG
ncbi:UNVERIFIED_CONTAM: hypothetical protein K2H54_056415 [Gekko kuhli]